VVLTEHTSRLNAFDELSIRSAARWATLDLVADRRGTMASWDARAMLARQLIDGTQDDDTRRSADRLAIELDRPRVVAFVTAPGQGGDAVDARSLVAALADRVDGDVLVTKDADGVAVLADIAGDAPPLVAVATAKSQIEAACGEVAEGLVAGLSTVCRTAQGLTRAYAEARDVARCIDRFAVTATPRVLAADDLGPARLFVANADAGGMDRFVKDLIGPLLDGEDAMTDLLRTLHAFFEAGRSVRDAGARLGIHPNTVRYRLGRVQTLTGLDAADNSDDQLSIQMSLLVLRLQGHLALPSFERAP
jgi:sugar diacid utilization regulator